VINYRFCIPLPPGSIWERPSCSSQLVPTVMRSRCAVSRDLQALADRLEQCGVRSDAMESTSGYWIKIYLPGQRSAQQERAWTQN
jgi:hypothetical protein